MPCATQPVRDAAFFLRRLRSLDHLPELEAAHTAMSSTWHRNGDVGDPADFKRIEGNRNILLDVDGPGCIHRIFTGCLGTKHFGGTHIQIFLDHRANPLFDLPVSTFFDYRNGPLPYPLVFHKTYPGILFPIPFETHCLVQLISADSPPRWGNYWQVTYTTYSKSTPVKSLTWPLEETAASEAKQTCGAWIEAETPTAWSPDVQWTHQHTWSLPPKPTGGDAEVFALQGCGVIQTMRLQVEPATPQVLRHVRMRITWDGVGEPSVDVPIGFFFGHAGQGHSPEGAYNSLPLRVFVDPKNGAESSLPMPFAQGAGFSFENRSDSPVSVKLHLEVQQRAALPDNWGRFHATWNWRPAAEKDAPRYGAQNLPVHIVLDRTGRGKYVGVMMCVTWPRLDWWGEGDWMIWTDEQDWPPSYHGTGTEEYFNSGWGFFDRKAVSGFVRMRPAYPTVYSFHLNDAFQFQTNIRVAVETTAFREARRHIENDHPCWITTAFWYAQPALPANSSSDDPPASAWDSNEPPRGLL